MNNPVCRNILQKNEVNTKQTLFFSKQEEEAKKEAAVASYEAWKEKKAESLRVKAKERQDTIRKEQRVTEEEEEKRLSAKKVNNELTVLKTRVSIIV